MVRPDGLRAAAGSRLLRQPQGNTLIGPDLINVNMSIVKTFQVREGQAVAFRSEFFNLFNRANFGLPNRFPFLADGSYSGSAGVIQSLATSSRQIQFGLRYSF